MNKQRFHSLLINSQHISSTDIQTLETLGKNFPYSQVIHALTAKAHLTSHSPQAQQKLGFAAIYTTDRGVLKKFVQGQGGHTQSVSSPQIPTQEKHTKDIIPKVPGAAHEGPPQGTETIERAESLSSGVMKSLRELQETKERIKSEEEKVLRKVNLDSVDDNSSQDDTKEQPVDTPKPAVDNSLEKTAEKTDASSDGVTVEINLIKDTKEEEVASDLRDSKGEEKSEETATQQVFDKDYVGELNNLEEKPIEGEVQSQQKEIIESFIEKEKKVIKRKVIPDTSKETIDLAKDSVSFADHLISENLAKILIRQGKKSKAIDIYKKLIWKFPQKKTYFAAQIEELKNS